MRFSEFLPDTQQVGQGVIVGQTGWETVLENNKQNFANQFVQRSRFTSAFPTSMTPAQFVDALNANAGNVLSSTDRTTAINLFGGASDTSNPSARAQAVRQVTENQNLVNAESNRAFVLIQYFGYLRRNPNDPQDMDYSGYDFWLTKLNQFNGNYNQAEMVKAFVNSLEYRGRFVLILGKSKNEGVGPPVCGIPDAFTSTKVGSKVFDAKQKLLNREKRAAGHSHNASGLHSVIPHAFRFTNGYLCGSGHANNTCERQQHRHGSWEWRLRRDRCNP